MSDRQLEVGSVSPANAEAARCRLERCDNLDCMAKLPDAYCDLIYIDPPFNCGRTLGPTKVGDLRFVDVQEDGLQGYLRMLTPRLREMRRLLSMHGSIYVHLDWRTVHHVRLQLDEIFGADQFLNEIIWTYRSGGRQGKWFRRKHDTILAYARSRGDHTFNPVREGTYKTQALSFDDDGRPYKNTRKGRLYFHPEGPAVGDVWDIPILSTVANERTGYPTQKPLRLINRIISAATNPGDMVADFFCGSGTTLESALRLGRNTIGCDINTDACDIARSRIEAVLAERDTARTSPAPGVDIWNAAVSP
ncbi:MAG: DNA-methyltransferase [Phycisphaerae bacterium]